MKFELFLILDDSLKEQLRQVESEYKQKKDKILRKMGELIADSSTEGWT